MELEYLTTYGLPLMINPYGELCWRVEAAPVKRGHLPSTPLTWYARHRRDLRLQGGDRTWIKPTVLDTFKKVFKSVEEWKEEAFNKSELTYQHYGSSFEFYGLDDSVRSYTVLRPISFGLTRLSKQARTTSTNWSKGAKASGF
jgi:hypothetical protein